MTEEPKIRKVLIGTPCYDGKIIVEYADSMLTTVMMGARLGIHISPIYLSYDSLVQRARNDLFKLAIEHDIDDMIFIDSDIQWKPENFFKLLNHTEDFVSGIYPKKSRQMEQYPVKIIPGQDLIVQDNDLMEVAGVPTGFLRLSKNAIRKLWDNSEEYYELKDANNTPTYCRMVCNVTIQNGQLLSEDMSMCEKWRDLGGKVFLDTSIDLNHYGNFCWSFKFRDYLDRVIAAEEAKKKLAKTPPKTQMASWAAKGDNMIV